jgi:hypothetical protein
VLGSSTDLGYRFSLVASLYELRKAAAPVSLTRNDCTNMLNSIVKLVATVLDMANRVRILQDKKKGTAYAIRPTHLL